MGKYFEIVMNEMCNRVGADWSKIDPKKPEWYTEYQWTEDEQKSFSEWMVDYLYNNLQARKEILTYSLRNKGKIREAVNKFLFNYGWKYK